MSLDSVANFIEVQASTGYTSSATSITLQSGQGSKLPATPFNLIWWNSTDYSNPANDPNVEIVRVTNVSSDTITITRGQESTSAANHNTSAKTYSLVLGITAKMITDIGSALTTGGTGTVTSVSSADGNATVANGTTTPTITIVSAPKLQTARTIDGQSFDGSANITVIAPGTHAATSKTTPVDADELPITDSAASYVLKKLTWANLLATAKTYFDTLYQATGAYITASSTDTLTNKNLTSGTNTFPTFNQSTTGNAATATALQNARTIAGVSFDGSANISITAADVSAIPSSSAPSGTIVGTTDTQTLSGKTLTKPTINGSVPAVTADTDGATITFDLSASNIHTVTLGGNRTLALSNVSTDQVFMLRLKQDATGSRVPTFFSTISWQGGTAPTLTTTGGKTDSFGFLCTGTNTYAGFVIGQNE